MAGIRIGIDLGGTKIEIAAFDDAMRFLLRRRVPTPAGDYAGILRAIVDLVLQAERAVGPADSIGVGVPGSLSPQTQLVRNANSTVLNGRAFAANVEASLHRPVRVTNDANCLALSEARDGAARGYAVVFAVILGTGVGGGIAVDGRVLEGAHRIAGEWGHNPLPWPRAGELPGPRCYCGKHGCIETFLSGPALAQAFFERSGRRADPAAIARRAAEGDAAAADCISTYEDRLARGLASVVNILDPDAIVLGGGVSNIDRLYANLPKLLPAYVFSDSLRTPVLRAAHGDSSGVRGAALLDLR